jgi:hypothetical protein
MPKMNRTPRKTLQETESSSGDRTGAPVLQKHVHKTMRKLPSGWRPADGLRRTNTVTYPDSRDLPIGGFGGLGGNGSGGGVGVGDGLGGVGFAGGGVSCMIQIRFMSSEVETSLTVFLGWKDKQSEISRHRSLAASLRFSLVGFARLVFLSMPLLFLAAGLTASRRRSIFRRGML